MIKHYINLTNGIEAIPEIKEDYHFIRIQSTACEQKRWNFLIQDLDNDLLMNLALGHTCIVYDYSKKGVSRALWQGVEFIRYVLNLYWLGEEITPFMRNLQEVRDYFYSEYSKLDNRTFKKLDYFVKFLLTNKIQLLSCGKHTDKDNKYDWYKEILCHHAV